MSSFSNFENGFDATLCSSRWRQFSSLETSGGRSDEDNSGVAIISNDRSDGNNSDCEHDGQITAAAAANDRSIVATATFERDDYGLSVGDPVGVASTSTETLMNSADIHRVLREIGCLVVDLRDRTKKNMYCGHFVKLLEMLKGNGQSIQGMSLEDILEDQVSMFTQQSTRNFVLTQDATAAETITIMSMPRGGPQQPNNRNMKRKRSSNEHMIEKNQQKCRCSLCFGQNHKANGCIGAVSLKSTMQAWCNRRMLKNWSQGLEILYTSWSTSLTRRLSKILFLASPTRSHQRPSIWYY